MPAGRPQTVTDEEMLAALRAAEINGRSPTVAQWAASNPPQGMSAPSIILRFGSWRAAGEAAGMNTSRAWAQGKPVPDPAVEANRLQRRKEIVAARRTGETLDSIGKRYGVTRERVRQITASDDPTAGLAASTLRKERRDKDRKTQATAKIVQTLADGGHLQDAARAAGTSVAEAAVFAEAVGIVPLRQRKARLRKWTPEKIIEQLQARAVDGYAPSCTEWTRQKCKPYAMTVVQEFGSWNAGVEAAGLKTRTRHGGADRNFKKYTDDEILDMIERLGVNPTCAEYIALQAEVGGPSFGLVRLRFRSWSEALNALARRKMAA